MLEKEEESKSDAESDIRINVSLVSTFKTKNEVFQKDFERNFTTSNCFDYETFEKTAKYNSGPNKSGIDRSNSCSQRKNSSEFNKDMIDGFTETDLNSNNLSLADDNSLSDTEKKENMLEETVIEKRQIQVCTNNARHNSCSDDDGLKSTLTDNAEEVTLEQRRNNECFSFNNHAFEKTETQDEFCEDEIKLDTIKSSSNVIDQVETGSINIYPCILNLDNPDGIDNESQFSLNVDSNEIEIEENVNERKEKLNYEVNTMSSMEGEQVELVKPGIDDESFNEIQADSTIKHSSPIVDTDESEIEENVVERKQKQNYEDNKMSLSDGDTPKQQIGDHNTEIEENLKEREQKQYCEDYRVPDFYCPDIELPCCLPLCCEDVDLEEDNIIIPDSIVSSSENMGLNIDETLSERNQISKINSNNSFSIDDRINEEVDGDKLEGEGNFNEVDIILPISKENQNSGNNEMSLSVGEQDDTQNQQINDEIVNAIQTNLLSEPTLSMLNAHDTDNEENENRPNETQKSISNDSQHHTTIDVDYITDIQTEMTMEQSSPILNANEIEIEENVDEREEKPNNEDNKMSLSDGDTSKQKMDDEINSNNSFLYDGSINEEVGYGKLDNEGNFNENDITIPMSKTHYDFESENKNSFDINDMKNDCKNIGLDEKLELTQSLISVDDNSKDYSYRNVDTKEDTPFNTKFLFDNQLELNSCMKFETVPSSSDFKLKTDEMQQMSNFENIITLPNVGSINEKLCVHEMEPDFKYYNDYKTMSDNWEKSQNPTQSFFKELLPKNSDNFVSEAGVDIIKSSDNIVHPTDANTMINNPMWQPSEYSLSVKSREMYKPKADQDFEPKWKTPETVLSKNDTLLTGDKITQNPISGFDLVNLPNLKNELAYEQWFENEFRNGLSEDKDIKCNHSKHEYPLTNAQSNSNNNILNNYIDRKPTSLYDRPLVDQENNVYQMNDSLNNSRDHFKNQAANPEFNYRKVDQKYKNPDNTSFLTKSDIPELHFPMDFKSSYLSNSKTNDRYQTFSGLSEDSLYSERNSNTKIVNPIKNSSLKLLYQYNDINDHPLCKNCFKHHSLISDISQIPKKEYFTEMRKITGLNSWISNDNQFQESIKRKETTPYFNEYNYSKNESIKESRVKYEPRKKPTESANFRKLADNSSYRNKCSPRFENSLPKQNIYVEDIPGNLKLRVYCRGKCIYNP